MHSPISYFSRSRVTACATSLMLALVASTSAHADMLDQRTELINKYVNEMHADPLVADCAAHGNFIASTSGYDHVDFPPGSFESGNAAITPWNNQAFDDGKQRVQVDNVVTVSGMGAYSDGRASRPVKFRCGYSGTQLLAFSWNDPRPALTAGGGEGRHGYRGHGRRHHGKVVRKHGKVSKHGTSKHHATTKNSAKHKVVRHKRSPA